MADAFRLPFAPAAPASPGAGLDVAGLLRLALLLGVLPLFLQNFHYMIDLPPAYALSKAWPIVTLPLAALALVVARPPYTALYACLLTYVLGITPLLAALHLDSSLIEAASATIRILPLIYGFSLAGMLWLVRPEPVEIRRAFLVLGGVTLAAYWCLWLVLPAAAYRSDPAESQAFFLDIERGYRIVLAMGFALVLVFWMARRAIRRRSLLWAAGVFASLVTMVVIYKQRTMIAATLVMLCLIVLRAMPARTRLLALALGSLVGLAGVFWWSFVLPDLSGELLGGSLSVRLRSSQLAWDFIGHDPWRWLFGVGSTTAYSDATLAEILGYRSFYLTDIGWLGVVTEFGVVGAVMILAALLVLVRSASRLAARAGDDFTGALADYAWLLLLITAIYSPVYAPGEMASLTALVWYLSRRLEGAAGR